MPARRNPAGERVADLVGGEHGAAGALGGASERPVDAAAGPRSEGFGVEEGAGGGDALGHERDGGDPAALPAGDRDVGIGSSSRKSSARSRSICDGRMPSSASGRAGRWWPYRLGCDRTGAPRVIQVPGLVTPPAAVLTLDLPVRVHVANPLDLPFVRLAVRRLRFSVERRGPRSLVPVRWPGPCSRVSVSRACDWSRWWLWWSGSSGSFRSL